MTCAESNPKYKMKNNKKKEKMRATFDQFRYKTLFTVFKASFR